MKKLFILFFTIMMVIITPVMAYGFSSPTVTEGQWDVMGVFVTTGSGLIIGGEYGISPELEVFAELGSSNATKIGIIYELQPNLGLTGGISGSGGFVGIIGSMPVGENLLGIGELDLKILDDQMAILYEAIVRYGFDKQWDIRGGLIGAYVGETNEIGLAFGVGYRF